MGLNHVQLRVADVAANRAFFEDHFGLRCVADRGDVLAVLADEDSIVALNHFPKAADFTYPDDYWAFHIGFLQPNRERVDAIHASLKAGGYAPEEPREFHGAWTFYVKAPGGFYVEVGHQHSLSDGGVGGS
ncbi:Glyoxalase/Bleomycin resistance protein/Dioxygenase superfamily protein [Aquisphaera giovannonii]|uniref:Glyoxalase/Bleomycin resistance protein/Dioxygenase superfamily protein n=1 Tax=Aquisphaera giovannonii TaxID=406548 RepID=A0A5B9WAT7_9BACT|nr:VOC family protein [Aquisphaera giovannonii]QEH37633.1 Glyoxalase/Bleomycin resistance protein/Dioxygenase superfamily protein [Aquisphaera giovannonii]